MLIAKQPKITDGLCRILVAAAVVFLAGSIPAFASTFSAKVVSVVDGDTLNVMAGEQKEKVILFGVDCPELAQEFGREAREFTDSRCYKKTVSIEEHGRDPRGRLIGVVYLPDGSNLNEQLVAQGFAWWSDKYAPNDAKLRQLHANAKAQRIGLWSGANPIAPWIFRNGEKNVQATIKPSAP